MGAYGVASNFVGSTVSKCSSMPARSSRREVTRGRADRGRFVTIHVTRNRRRRRCMVRTFSPNCTATCLCVSPLVKPGIMIIKVLTNNASDCVLQDVTLKCGTSPDHAVRTCVCVCDSLLHHTQSIEYIFGQICQKVHIKINRGISCLRLVNNILDVFVCCKSI